MQRRSKSHVVITGTGRAGTTFLVHLMTALGLDTGYKPDGALSIDPRSRGGLEWDLLKPNAPYIVKSPYLSVELKAALIRGIKVDHAIVPVRLFKQAAASRVRVHAAAIAEGHKGAVPGGLWKGARPGHQIMTLQRYFCTLFETLAEYDIPVTLVWYPRLVLDADYLYDKLGFLMNGVDRERFKAIFAEISRPSETVAQIAVRQAAI